MRGAIVQQLQPELDPVAVVWSDEIPGWTALRGPGDCEA